MISWGVGGGWIAEFDWVGTRDPTPFLCAPEGLRFIDDQLGGRDALWARNHALAWQVAEQSTHDWGLPWHTPRSMVASMVTLPLPEIHGRGAEAAAELKNWLLAEASIEAQILAIEDASGPPGRLYWRFSAQAYNDAQDVERFTKALAAFAARR